jgi:hypothetical protein
VYGCTEVEGPTRRVGFTTLYDVVFSGTRTGLETFEGGVVDVEVYDCVVQRVASKNIVLGLFWWEAEVVFVGGEEI